MPVGERAFRTLAALRYVPTVPGFRDVLWMVPYDSNDFAEEWNRMKIAMQNRLRWSSEGGSGEFTQAAATQLVFAECQTVYAHLSGEVEG